MAKRIHSTSVTSIPDPGTLAVTQHDPPRPTGSLDSDFNWRREIIDAVCAMTSDRWTLEVARKATMSRNGHASAHLDYYLGGKGGTLTVDLAQLIAEDEGVRKKLNVEIMNKMLDGKSEGTVSIPQVTYTNKDWLYAIGGMNINWRSGPPLAQDKVRVGFRNTYRWHPNDDRITQCVHQAAVRLQSDGANDFVMEGGTVITPSVDEWSKSDSQETHKGSSL